MAPELSTNWKKLQASLGSTAGTSKSSSTKKRKQQKAPEGDCSSWRGQRSTKRPKMAEDGGHASNGGVAAAAAGPSSSSSSVSLALWAEDNGISASDLAAAYGTGTGGSGSKAAAAAPATAAAPAVHKDTINGGLIAGVEVGKYVSLDCEMVGVGVGGSGGIDDGSTNAEDRSALARVSIVNYHGAQVYDSFVRPRERVTDWRTAISGVSPAHMATARPFADVQRAVAAILDGDGGDGGGGGGGRVLVGHAVKNDLAVLELEHPRADIRDTGRYAGFRKYGAGRTPSLKKLAMEVLGVEIQAGQHSSIEDARVTMLLFRRHKEGFDVEHAQRYPIQKVEEGRSGKQAKPKRKKKSKR